MNAGVRRAKGLVKIVAATVLAGVAAATPGAAGATAPSPGGTPWPGYHRIGGDASGRLGATVRRTRYGVAHIEARDDASLGYGIGYAFAEDNICTIADSYVTVAGERSKYFGPGGSWVFSGNDTRFNNLDSDAFYGWVNQRGFVERLAAEPPPRGPLPGVRDLVRGYVAGYNAYLRDVGGAAGIPDPRCKGAAWVRPITEVDAYRRFFQLASLASSGVAIDGIAQATPLLGAAAPSGARRDAMIRALGSHWKQIGIGSNAYGIGGDATEDHHGLVLGNPHFPWHGAERLWQVHLHSPRFEVSGAALYGVPLVNIGHTKGLAWSHTVATAFRFTPFELKLVPGDPYSYLVDGVPTKMRATTVRIATKGADGALSTTTRTIHESVHGPVLTSIFGLPLFPWNGVTAYALGDANATNFRYLNHFYENDQAQSVRDYHAIQERYQGIPWVNSLAADRSGEAYYSMNGAIPNVSDAFARQCDAVLGVATFAAIGLPVLDGSRSSCTWPTAGDAAAPGIMGNSRIPYLFRRDYVENGNDSHWLVNAHQRLEGYDRIVGVERTERTPRTRLGLLMAEQRIAGTDGLPGRGFTLQRLMDVALGDRQYLGELWRDRLVALCRANPSINGVDVSSACPILAAWDLHDGLDSAGAVLFRRFAVHAYPATLSLPAGTQGSTELGLRAFTTPFDPADPLNTPNGLADTPLVRQALADAVTDLQGAGLPLDATLRTAQSEDAGGVRVAVHGGPGELGVFNAITATWNPKRGYDDVVHGSSFIMAAHFKDGACPAESRTFVTYGQSENPRSPHRADQLVAFRDKHWNHPPFCRDEVLAAPEQRVEVLGSACAPRGGIGPVRLTVRGRRVRVTVRPRGAGAPVRVRLLLTAAGGAGTHTLATAVTRATASLTVPRPVRSGDLVVALQRRTAGGLVHERRLALRATPGGIRRGVAFWGAPTCAAVRHLAATAPSFGGTGDVPATLRYRVDRRATVRIDVLRGGRVLRRLGSRITPGERDEQRTLAAHGLRPGLYTVRLRAALGTGRTEQRTVRLVRR